MRAAFFTASGFELRQVPPVVVGRGEIEVEVYACGVCGSDLHFFTGATPPPRVCPGHEISGRVVSGSDSLPPGTPVVVEPLRSCERCASCLRGQPNLCPRLQILGLALPGGFADRVVVPERSVYRLPPDLDLESAILVEPLAVAVHALGLGGVGAGCQVLVLGGGTIGTLVAFGATRRGATVTVSARYPHQGEAARRVGAQRIIAATADAVRSATAERPPDVVLETVGGSGETLALALEVARPGGRIVALGVSTQNPTLDAQRLLAKEVSIVGAMMYDRQSPRSDFAVALELLQGEHDRLAALITHRVPLEDITRGFAIASDKRSGAMKVAIDVARTP